MAQPLTIDDVPGPHALPILGNIRDLAGDNPLVALGRMADEYGGVFRLTLPTGSRLVVSDPAVVDEICDETRFYKTLGAGVKAIQDSVAGQGLFAIGTDDPLWERAHNILMRPFSQEAMQSYMPRMLDIADQLMHKWARTNPGDAVDVPSDMTAVTLDTIALCGFDYRFNSLHRTTPHPLVDVMNRSLATAQAAAKRLPIQTRLHVREARRVHDDQQFLRTMMQGLIDDRRALGDDADNRDLLGRMLEGIDPTSGKGLPDDNIIAQCLTFLIAGHETTSSLLSFAIYFLLEDPAIFQRARAEVDEVLGTDAWPTYDQVRSLTYVRQILDEALRMWPPAPQFTRAAREDTVIQDTYAVSAGLPMTVLITKLHRSREIWGDDADEFNPEHFSPERKATTPPNAYKPFGTGMRACIGRQFALQEATLILGMIIQRFDLIDHTDYQLHLRNALTVKPADFFIQVRARAGFQLDRTGPTVASSPQEVEPSAGPVSLVDRHGTPLTVLFGSNLGTSEGIATKLATEGTERGFDVTLAPLDDQVHDLPTDGAVIVVCSSYNGFPTENATQFCDWLEDPATVADACAGVSYTVFGCGDSDWVATYQKVPTMVDAQLAAHGATRIHPRGEGNASGDFDRGYADWAESVWDDVAAAVGLDASAITPVATGPRLAVSMVNQQKNNPLILSYEAEPALVTVNRELERSRTADPLDRSVRHVEVALAEGQTYATGDHLGIVPRNRLEQIRRVMRQFELDAGTSITIVPKSGTHTHLPIDEPAPLLAVLGAAVELQDVASREHIATLARHTDDADQRAALEALVGDDDASHERYNAEVVGPYKSILDLLEAHPATDLPFEVYLDMLPPLRPRYYSISSSPRASTDASITVAVVRAPNRAQDGVFAGVASNYLSAMAPGSTVFGFVRKPTIAFHPPADPSVPMIMVGAGTGLAPFRGFLQERAALQDDGVEIGASLTFFGCREPRDHIYADELADYEQQGVTTMRTVYSSDPVDGRRYVQHEMAHRADEVWDLIDAGASIFVCGNANTMAPGVRAALMDIQRDKTGGTGTDAQAWLDDLASQDRFVQDIWGG